MKFDSCVGQSTPKKGNSMSQPKNHSGDLPEGQVSRRKLFAGAGTLGAIAATASLLPVAAPVVAPKVPVKVSPAKGGGYHLSEHVKRYYKTTLV
jgi:hypothetical protein